jgi:hypothetical protein
MQMAAAGDALDLMHVEGFTAPWARLAAKIAAVALVVSVCIRPQTPLKIRATRGGRVTKPDLTAPSGG